MILPEFVAPMLAVGAEAFSSDRYLFEIKWDGTRALAFVEDGDYRLLNRRRRVLTPRYPELAILGRLPSGTAVDGEVFVVEDDGQPSFRGLLRREQAQDQARIAALAASLPATYAVFDLLYLGGRPVMDRPLLERRQLLADILTESEGGAVVFSDGIIGHGEDYFRQVVASGLEGVVAKRVDSRYLPGRRTDAWRKIKRHETICCVIIGYVPEDPDGVRSLVVAAEEKGVLRSVGRVGSGLNRPTGRQLARALGRRHREDPVVPAAGNAIWVEAEVYCIVKYMERTPGGNLRSPVFLRLVKESEV